MEGAHPDAASGKVQEMFDAAPHLARRLVGEGHRQQLARLGATLLDQPGDAMRQHPRFAATGTGKDQQRAVVGRDSRPLRRVQALQKIDAMLGSNAQITKSLPSGAHTLGSNPTAPAIF